MTDDRIRELARQHEREDDEWRRKSQAAAAAEAEWKRVIESEMPKLWGALEQAIKQRAEEYNAERKQQAMHVEVTPDSIRIRAEDRGVVLHLALRANPAVGTIDGTYQTPGHVGPGKFLKLLMEPADHPTCEIRDGRAVFVWPDEIAPDEVSVRAVTNLWTVLRSLTRELR